MPVDSGNDLFLYQYPESPVSEVFHIRPFRPEDEEECYRVCLQTWDDGMDASQDFASHPTQVGEKSIGPLLTFYPGLGFVFENNEGQIETKNEVTDHSSENKDKVMLQRYQLYIDHNLLENKHPLRILFAVVRSLKIKHLWC